MHASTQQCEHPSMALLVIVWLYVVPAHLFICISYIYMNTLSVICSFVFGVVIIHPYLYPMLCHAMPCSSQEENGNPRRQKDYTLRTWKSRAAERSRHQQEEGQGVPGPSPLRGNARPRRFLRLHQGGRNGGIVEHRPQEDRIPRLRLLSKS